MYKNISYTAKVNKVKYYNAIIKHHLWNYKEEQIYTTNLVSCLVIQWDIMWYKWERSGFEAECGGSRQDQDHEMVDNEVVISMET